MRTVEGLTEATLLLAGERLTDEAGVGNESPSGSVLGVIGG